VAEALARVGTGRAVVVTGADGLDEVSLAGASRVLVVEGGTVETLRWLPADFGLGTVATADLRVSGPADSAARIGHLLAGEPGAVPSRCIPNTSSTWRPPGRMPSDSYVLRAGSLSFST